MIQPLKTLFTGARPMQSTKLAENYYVAGQITLDDVKTIATQGFNAVMCNRPDGEENQPSSSEFEAACKAEGLEFHYLPMVGPNYSAADVSAVQALNNTNKKVFAYCRTGNRCTILFNAAQG